MGSKPCLSETGYYHQSCALVWHTLVVYPLLPEEGV